VRVDDDLTYLREYEHVTLARILLAEHRVTGSSSPLRDACTLVDRLLGAAQAGGRAGTVVELEVLRALAHHASGHRQAAVEALERAIDIAEPEGWVRFVVDAAPGLADVLPALAERRPASGYVRRLLSMSAGSAHGTPAPPEARQALVDPLSARELEVLRFLGSDLDGPSIARELVVSLNTVRTHTKHIYTKLDVNNRRAAVSKAHQLGLMSRAVRG
jgi:LuxR family maltose regulon positive regulatory protein